MPLAFLLIFGGVLLIYMGLDNKSLNGILTDTNQPISNPNSPAPTSNVPVGAGVSQAVSGPVGLGVAEAVSGYVAPFDKKQLTQPLGRTDQGVDYDLRPGSPIRAIGDSKVIGIIPNWYGTQPFIWLQLLDGPKKGSYYYVAEQINPLVKPGQVVKAGQAIATFAAQGTGDEIGWASASGQTLAKATTGYSEGEITPAGLNFRGFLSTLGIS